MNKICGQDCGCTDISQCKFSNYSPTMQTELPEETKRIHEEAKAWADTLVKTMGGVLRIDRALCEGCYEQGVTNEATRAQVLVEGLKEIEKIVLKYHSLNGDNPVANHCRNIAMESLVKYHQ